MDIDTLVELEVIFYDLRMTASNKKRFEILRKNKDFPYLKDIFNYAYNDIQYAYGITSDYVNDYVITENPTEFSGKDMFTVLDLLNNRVVIGHRAMKLAKTFVMENPKESNLFFNILDRNLMVGVNTKTVNKIWPDLIPKPNYNRCAIFNKNTAKKINFPAYVQLKCDGTYREVVVCENCVDIRTRSGEYDDNASIRKHMYNLPEGYYIGEYTLGPADKPDANRAVTNGLINKNNPPYDDIHFTIWDYLTPEDYVGSYSIDYNHRFERLLEIYHEFIEETEAEESIHICPTYQVDNIEEALAVTEQFMNQGLEGAVLKDLSMKFINGTNPLQLKIKLKVDCEMRITGFTEGTGSRKGKVGAILFENDNHIIKGACSGFSNKELEEFTAHPDKYIGKIITVQFNDLSKSPENDYYALTHPRFICIRDDKTEPDTLDTVRNLITMAKSLK